MSAAHRDLRRVLASLASRLDGQVDGMLAADRFAEGRAALDRLRGATQAELDHLPDDEAAWLADELRRRWELVGRVVLDPVAWLEAAEPDGVGTVRVTVHADDVEPGWTVSWTGADPHGDDPTSAVWTPSDAGGGTVTARVMGRGGGGRVILTASWRPPDGASGTPAGP